MIAIIVQARMGSTRLPGKVLKIVAGKTLLDHLIDRLKKVENADKIVIATTVLGSDDNICKVATDNGVECFRGSENDVLDRYYQTAKKYNADHIVRITADCPMMDPEIVDKVITFYSENKDRFDYVSNVLPPTYPDGMDVEVFSFKALEGSWKNAKLHSEREHVTDYITNHEADFRRGNVGNDEDNSDLRLTVDNPEDLELTEKIFNKLYLPGKIFGLAEILSLFKSCPELPKINSYIRRNEGYEKSLQNDYIVKSRNDE